MGYSPWGHKELDTTERLANFWTISPPRFISTPKSSDYIHASRKNNFLIYNQSLTLKYK